MQRHLVVAGLLSSRLRLVSNAVTLFLSLSNTAAVHPAVMADFGFNEHHQNEVINYMRFARSKRLLRLKTIDSCFQDLKDSRLVEETFTVDEVTDMLDGLQVVVRGEVEMELINTAHTNVLLLRQLFSQAEKFYLRLQTDISELENRELLEQVAEFEKTDFKSNSKGNQESSKPKLAPLNEGGVSELLNKEISRLQEENDKLRTRLRTLESQAMSALDERSKAERALKDLQKIQGDQQELSNLEDTVAAMQADFEKSLNANVASQKELQDNLVSAKHDLLRVQEQLSLAEKELEKKFQQTAAYRNMKEILSKKNDQIKDLRKRLQRYESDE
ncbi:leucine zipper transcription factor-like protein 1 isoform X2 [Astyanax mexicanus]|uniref:Leucine zipper transcription factor-like protein 1 n=2 Tax=Astyanax mexicanus TaxID=7994 RepID=A0A8T2MGU1_ASTMX|nr:leucine zipper transcription factor-like protein 1 isoform X2 [Astyanax mexicanus]